MSTGQSSNCGDVNHHGGDYVLAWTFFPPSPLYIFLPLNASISDLSFYVFSLPPFPLSPRSIPLTCFFFFPAPWAEHCARVYYHAAKAETAQTPPLFSLLIFLLSLVNTDSHFSWSPFCNALFSIIQTISQGPWPLCLKSGSILIIPSISKCEH